MLMRILRSRVGEKAGVSGRKIRKPQPRELPARGGGKEIAVAYAWVSLRRRHRWTAQQHLDDHQFSIVFAQRTGDRAVGRIRTIMAARPLPDNAECILQFAGACRDFPFGFARQMLTGPARERVGLVITHVADRQFLINRMESAERETVPTAIHLAPMPRCRPILGRDYGPAVGQP